MMQFFVGGTLLANDLPNRERDPLLGDKRVSEESEPSADVWEIPGDIDPRCNPSCCISISGDALRSIKDDLTDSRIPKGECLPNGVRRMAQVGTLGFLGLIIWGITNVANGNN